MNTITKATKWMGAAAMAAVMFFGLSHKAEAQHVSFGVQIGGPVVVAQPAYPYGYGYYGNGGYYGDRYYGNRYYNNGYGYYGRDDWRWRQYDQHQRWDRDRRFDRDHDRGGWDRDHGGRGYGRR